MPTDTTIYAIAGGLQEIESRSQLRNEIKMMVIAELDYQARFGKDLELSENDLCWSSTEYMLLDAIRDRVYHPEKCMVVVEEYQTLEDALSDEAADRVRAFHYQEQQKI